MTPALLVISAALAGLPAADEPGAVIASMDELRFAPPKEKGRAELVEGRSGKAIRFQFDPDARGAFFTSNIHGTPEWDRASGFSFWVKGDGQDGFGGLEFIYDDDYTVRYDLAFPIEGTEWTKVTVAWSDLIPVLPGPRAKPLGGPDGNAPSKITGMWFGKWWYWGDYPSLSFAVDDVRLEPRIERDVSRHRPEGAPLARVREKVRAVKLVTIVTMGDSLTDKRHWANRQVAWIDLLREDLKTRTGSGVTIVNPAIGGTQLRQNLILMPLWLAKAPEPDLVTVFFGGNDWDAGVRGEEFERTCADAIDRIRRATGGKSDVLLMTTNPSASRWDATAELAEACRRAAHDRNAALADTDRAFRDAGVSSKERLFVDDRVHLSRAGHELVAKAVERAIEDDGPKAEGKPPEAIARFFQPPPELRDDLGPYRSPLLFADGRKARTEAEWQDRRAEILKAWNAEMGEWPPILANPKIEERGATKREGYTEHAVRLAVAPDRTVDGYLLVPDGKGPFPAMVVVFYEPESAIGKRPEVAFARRLAKAGVASLSIGFDPRVIDTDRSAIKLQPLSYLAYCASNARAALATRPEIKPDRIGVMGHSYGGKWAMFAACLDEKFACGVWSDPGVAFDASRSNVNYWEPWYLGWEPARKRKPGLPTADNPTTGAYRRLRAGGHDLHEFQALMAPRPFLVSGGSEDPPDRWKALNHAVAVNRLLGAENRVAMTNRPGHTPTEEANEQIVRFVEWALK